MTNNNTFVKGFLAKINSTVSNEQLQRIEVLLNDYVSNYEITIRQNQVALVQPIPDALKVFLVSKKIEGLSDTTLKDYQSKLETFFRYIKFPLAEITTQDIQVFLYRYSEGYTKVSAHSMRQFQNVLNSFFEWCTNNGFLEKNPCAAIGKIKYEKKEIDVLSDTQVRELLNVCDNPRDKAIISLLTTTGIRVSELINIRCEDIAWDTKEDTYSILIHGKGNKERYVFMTTQCALDVLEYIQVSNNKDKVFNISVRSVQYIVEKCGEKIGIQGLHPHTLRHTVATELASKGTRINLVQKMLGHSSSATTTKYYVRSEYEQLQKEISEKLN